MKALIRIRTFRALCVLLAVAGQAAAIVAQSGPPSKERYIIVLKPPKSGVPELSDHDITAGGGKIEYKVPGRIQVTLPEPAVEALRKQERVKYIQKVILGPLPDASAPAALRTTPSTASLRATAESTPPTWRSGTFKYDASGNIYAIGLAADTGSPLQHRYAYDELSRLKQADTLTTPAHTETFTYDIYGNLTEHVDGSSTTSTPVEDPNTNRLAWSAAHPYTYDAAGNLTADYNASYAYDPFNMLREKDYTNEQPEYYIYTASDERIGVKYGTSSGSPTIWSIRDFSGNVLRQYEGHDQSPQMAWLWVEDYIYRDGQLLAAERVPEEGGRRHFHLDHLGSPRLVTGSDSKEMSEHDYEPFGLESNFQETAGGFDREDPKRFTGHERDYAAPGSPPASTAYLDYMQARYYSSNVGRFLSVDPIPGDVHTPQSWNLYAYVRNNPLRGTDQTGLSLQVMTDQAATDLCTMIGPRCADQIQIGKDGNVTVTATDADLKGNEALNLVNDMVQSKNQYGAWEGTSMPSGSKTLTLGPHEKDDTVINLSKTARTDIPQGLNLPLPPGFDGAVGIFGGYPSIAKGQDGRPVSMPMLLFHELAENYYRTDKMKQYVESHQNAITRENLLRVQRPELKQFANGWGVYIVTPKP